LGGVLGENWEKILVVLDRTDAKCGEIGEVCGSSRNAERELHPIVSNPVATTISV
jgi:hypothetical protein